MPDRTDRPRILWVTEEAPDHTGGGGSIRQAYLLDALASTFSVDLLLAGKLRDDRVREVAASVAELRRRRAIWTEHPVGRRALGLAIAIGARYGLLAYASYPDRRVLGRAISERQHDYDLVCVEHEMLAPLIPRSRSQPWIVTLHALFSVITEHELELVGEPHQRWFWRRELRKAHALEQRVLRRYDRCVVCSEEDATALSSSGGGQRDRIVVIPNGVDLERFRPAPLPTEPRVLFPATLSYPANVDGAVWFCTEIWPAVRSVVPGATLVIAGRSPVDAVLELEQVPGVSVDPDVPSMAPYFESARVVVVPLRVGGGTRLKALDAMASARPVVGTMVGLEGLGIADGVQALVADTPEPFAAAVVRTLRDDELVRSLGDAGRAHVERHFGWDRVGERFVEMVSALIATA
jgi:glycosyltransferase involved in cell wall biosynthesis